MSGAGSAWGTGASDDLVPSPRQGERVVVEPALYSSSSGTSTGRRPVKATSSARSRMRRLRSCEPRWSKSNASLAVMPLRSIKMPLAWPMMSRVSNAPRSPSRCPGEPHGSDRDRGVGAKDDGELIGALPEGVGFARVVIDRTEPLGLVALEYMHTARALRTPASAALARNEGQRGSVCKLCDVTVPSSSIACRQGPSPLRYWISSTWVARGRVEALGRTVVLSAIETLAPCSRPPADPPGSHGHQPGSCACPGHAWAKRTTDTRPQTQADVFPGRPIVTACAARSGSVPLPGCAPARVGAGPLTETLGPSSVVSHR